MIQKKFITYYYVLLHILDVGGPSVLTQGKESGKCVRAGKAAVASISS